MKKIVVISDTHGNKTALKQIMPIAKEADMILHAGDGVSDLTLFNDLSAEIYGVRGNCDVLSQRPIEQVITVEGVNIYITHGHGLSVKKNQDELIKRAKELGCSVCIYGHTHKEKIEKVDDILVINPGTLSSRNVEKCFCYLVINQEKAVATLNKNFN